MELNKKTPLLLKVVFDKINLDLDDLKNLNSEDTIYLNKEFLYKPVEVYISNYKTYAEVCIIDGQIGIQLMDKFKSYIIDSNNTDLNCELVIETTLIKYEDFLNFDKGSIISLKKDLPIEFKFYINNTIIENYVGILLINSYDTYLIKIKNKKEKKLIKLTKYIEEVQIKNNEFEQCLATLNKMDNLILANHLINENYVIIASILMLLDENKKIEILNIFHKDMQKELKEIFLNNIKTNDKEINNTLEILLNTFLDTLKK